jgi:hypothetical protein
MNNTPTRESARQKERSTDLRELRNGSGTGFTWGNIVKWYEIGPYVIAEFHPWIYKNGCGTGIPHKTKKEFHGWIKGKDTCNGWHTLEAAMVGIVAYKLEGCNSRAGEYFMRMVAKGVPRG